MKRLLSYGLFLAMIGCMAGAALAADEAKPTKIRVLLTIGGHGFEEKPFYEMFDKMPGITYKKAVLPEELDLLKPGLEKDFDVIVMYDMCKPAITPEQQKNFVALLEKGIGLVPWHHNMAAHQKWDGYRKIIRGKFFTEPGEVDGQKFKISGWEHAQDMKVTVADKTHPITHGVSNFEIHDEVYNNYWTDPGVKVLLTTDHPKNDPELAWVSQYGNSRVFFLMLGHDSKAWANPNFQKILQQGIRWAAQK